jgi:hypothetical protein
MVPSTPIIRPFSDSYLLGYSDEHVFYEIDHFFWLAQLLGGGTIALGASSPADITRLNNILIEGFAIHLRNMIDFLYVDPYPTDVVAADFFHSGDRNKIRPAITNSLEAAKVRANKEIAHLTTERIAGAPPAKRWDFPGLADELRPLLRLVSARALPSMLSPKVGAAIR